MEILFELWADFQRMKDCLASINQKPFIDSLPFVLIEGSNVASRIPAVSRSSAVRSDSLCPFGADARFYHSAAPCAVRECYKIYIQIRIWCLTQTRI